MRKPMFMKKRIAIMSIIIMFSVLQSETFAGGFTNNGIGSKAYAMGCAFTGVADDASAVYFNPAGLSFNTKGMLYGDIYADFNFTEFTYYKDSVKEVSDEKFVVPGFFISRTYENWAFGFGAYIPYAGGGTAYEDFLGYPYDFENASGFIAFNPSVAYKIRDNLSVGAGLSLYYGVMEAKYFDPNLLTEIKTNYDGIAGYGGHIGVMYKPTKIWSLGLFIKSEIQIELDGEMTIEGIDNNSEVELTLPYVFTLGVGFKPKPELTIGLDVSYLLYSDLDEITVKTDGFPADPVPTFYENSFEIRLGMEYRISKQFAVRTGFYFSEGATKDKGLNPASNDVDVLQSCIGVGYRITKSIEMAVSGFYVYGFEEEYNSQKFDQEHFILVTGLRFIYDI